MIRKYKAHFFEEGIFSLLSWRPYHYPIYNPEGKKAIHIFKHAIDGIWEAEE
jgi:hypothetical protein